MPTKSTLSRGATTSRRALLSAASSSARLGRPDDVAARLLIEIELDQPFGAGVLEQVGKAAVAVVGLVEAGLPALERLLDHRAPDLLARAALRAQRLQGLGHEVESFLLLLAARGRGFLAFFGGAALLLVLAHQVVVVDEFVAIR